MKFKALLAAASRRGGSTWRIGGFNMRFQALLAAAAAALSLGVGGAQAATVTPLRLDYAITAQAGGTYLYDFDLVLDNNDGSWVAGQEWDWIVFGDRAGSVNAPSGFCPTGCSQADLARITPITPGLTGNGSGGGFQGPMVQWNGGPALPGWEPTAVGQKLEWTYTSSILLSQGALYWSTVVVGDGARAAQFNVANLTSAQLTPPSAAPEPAAWALMIGGFGLAGAALRRRRALAA